MPVRSVFIIISARLLFDVLPKILPINEESPVPITFPMYIIVIHMQKHLIKVNISILFLPASSLGSFLIIKRSIGNAIRYNGKNDIR